MGTDVMVKPLYWWRHVAGLTAVDGCRHRAMTEVYFSVGNRLKARREH